ncbi:hypothetical protein [Streptomyces sp. N35]|uniref:hypothetical protein n=1 Tax=Streptomyces sp. N35 TaxID=2795730 RepID=UPI0018F430BD|nr:hypothetical protein [Streptomyces sp. N35]
MTNRSVFGSTSGRRMRARLRARARAAAVGLSLVALTGLAATPAHAADDGPACTTTAKTFNTQFTASPQVWVKLCVSYDGDYRVDGTIWWSGAGGAGSNADGDRHFDGFLLTVRLEQYVNGADTTYQAEHCDYRGLINGSFGGGEFYCDIPVYSHSRTSTWSADGTVTYNYDEDGEGDKLWNLQGTRRID